jgi:hypothetical protein
MLKTVTCSLLSICRAADKQGIRLQVAGRGNGPVPNVDVILRPVTLRPVPIGKCEVAIEGKTLAGQLFLSLLVAGALG